MRNGTTRIRDLTVWAVHAPRITLPRKRYRFTTTSKTRRYVVYSFKIPIENHDETDEKHEKRERMPVQRDRHGTRVHIVTRAVGIGCRRLFPRPYLEIWHLKTTTNSSPHRKGTKVMQKNRSFQMTRVEGYWFNRQMYGPSTDPSFTVLCSGVFKIFWPHETKNFCYFWL